MNCILYARVSTDKQSDLSIPAQLDAMRAYAHQHHWAVAEEFIEPGASAKTADRPALQQLLARVRNPKIRTDVVVVHKIDRLARNVYDHATIKALLKQRSIQLASVVENVDDTVPGQLVENIMASIAQFYSANLSEEVKKGMREKLKRGGWPHLPPRGYVSVRNADGRGSKVVAQPSIAPLVTKAFELYATGHYGLRALAVRLAENGLLAKSGLPLPVSQIRRVLANPFYVGRVVSKGIDLPGAHTPLVSSETFERVQHILKTRYRDCGIKGTVRGFVLRGVAICASCRGRMTAENHGADFNYYRCSRQSYKKEKCAARFCNAKVAHAEVERLCRQIQIHRDTAGAVRQATLQVLSTRSANREKHAARFAAEHASLINREQALTEAYTRGELTPETYQRRATQLRSRKVELERLVTAPAVPDAKIAARVKESLEIATCLWDLYRPLDEFRRNELLRAVFKTVVLAPEGILGFSLNAPFNELHKGTRRSPQTVAETLVESLAAA
jgi:DNA invertase Pin-like site-specific DNA recombinase